MGCVRWGVGRASAFVRGDELERALFAVPRDSHAPRGEARLRPRRLARGGRDVRQQDAPGLVCHTHALSPALSFPVSLLSFFLSAVCLSFCSPSMASRRPLRRRSLSGASVRRRSIWRGTSGWTPRRARGCCGRRSTSTPRSPLWATSSRHSASRSVTAALLGSARLCVCVALALLVLTYAHAQTWISFVFRSLLSLHFSFLAFFSLCFSSIGVSHDGFVASLCHHLIYMGSFPRCIP